MTTESPVDLDDLQQQILDLSKKQNNKMTRVILESPYSGDIDRNTRYARICCKDSFLRGENPFASHLFYTQFLDEETQREEGVDLGYECWDSASKIVFYVDLGLSNGMREALLAAIEERKPIEFRYLYQGPLAHENQHLNHATESPIHGAVPDIQRP